jgi:hypothetical protein
MKAVDRQDDKPCPVSTAATRTSRTMSSTAKKKRQPRVIREPQNIRELDPATVLDRLADSRQADEAVVADLVEKLGRGITLPTVVIYASGPDDHYHLLIPGQRNLLEAHRRVGRATVKVSLCFRCDRKDALLHTAMFLKALGLTKPEDKRWFVAELYKYPDLAAMPPRVLVEPLPDLSKSLVYNYRDEMAAAAGEDEGDADEDWMPRNYEDVKAEAKRRRQYQRCSVKDLIAMAPSNDPFYRGQPALENAARWYERIWRHERDEPTEDHLRRCHYWLVVQEGGYPLPGSRSYPELVRASSDHKMQVCSLFRRFLWNSGTRFRLLPRRRSWPSFSSMSSGCRPSSSKSPN